MSLMLEKPSIAPRAMEWTPSTRIPLTDREQQVLKLVAQGYTNREVALILSLSPKTVEAHRAHTLNKLGLHSRAELVRYALREGYLAADF